MLLKNRPENFAKFAANKRVTMKLKFLSIFLLGIATIAFAQIRKIPPEVTEAFKVRYPHAEKVSWKDNITSFEAEFLLNDYKMRAYFNSKGEWQSSEKNIKFEDLPREVKDGFAKSKYSDWEKGSIVETDKNGEGLIYRMLVKKSGVQKKYLYFDTSGKLTRDAVTL
jgi:hypothetical protein